MPLKPFLVEGTLAETAALIGDELVVVVGVICVAVAAPDVPVVDAVEAPPVAVAVDVADDRPPFAEAEPLFEPAPPAPAVMFTAVVLVAELVCDRVLVCELVLLPVLVGDAVFDCVVAPAVADGLLLSVALSFVCVAVPDPMFELSSAVATVTDASATQANTARMARLRLYKTTPSIEQ